MYIGFKPELLRVPVINPNEVYTLTIGKNKTVKYVAKKNKR